MQLEKTGITLLVVTGIIYGCSGSGGHNQTKGGPKASDQGDVVVQERPQQSPEEKARELAKLMSRSVDINNKEGLTALKSKDYDTAEKLFLVSLRQVDNYQNQSARKAIILNNLASVYEAKEMYAQAVPLLSKAQKLFIKAYGRKDPTVAITLNNLGRILSKQHRYEEASYVYKTAVSLIEESGNTKGADYKEALDALLVALRKNGQGMQVAALESKIKSLSK